ncbi:hypothetical protein HC928_24535 [bacterium]|nr:hypothetical protein [bacterium]
MTPPPTRPGPDAAVHCRPSGEADLRLCRRLRAGVRLLAQPGRHRGGLLYVAPARWPAISTSVEAWGLLTRDIGVARSLRLLPDDEGLLGRL